MSNDTIDSNVAVMERPRQHRENRKKNIGRKVAPNQAFAVVKFIRVPPRKARLVINEVSAANTPMTRWRFCASFPTARPATSPKCCTPPSPTPPTITA